MTYVAENVIFSPHRKYGEAEENIVRKFRTNQGITAREVRLIGEDGEQLGIMPLRQALEMSRERNTDLVEVAPTAVPPVCRLLDYGRFMYEQSKKEQEARKRQKATLLREVRLRPRISEHDLERKTSLVGKFLEGGDKVKVMVLFRGREVTHPEIATELLRRMFSSLKETAVIEKPPTLDGRIMTVILSPQKQREPKTTKES